MNPEIREQARNRWRGVLHHLGVEERFLRPKHGPCIFCGGKDRYRFDDKEGTGSFFCSHCGPGDGMEFVMRLKGVEFKEAARIVREVVETVKPQQPRPERTSAAVRQQLVAMWKGSKPVQSGDEVDRYLRGRGIELEAWPEVLRMHPKLPYYDDASESGTAKLVGHFPAMLAKVVSPQGESCGIHRTYLMDGQKAPVEKARKMAGKTGRSIAIRLFEASDIVHVAEGIETALAVHLLTDSPVWACVSAGSLEAFEWPEVRRLAIWADNDASFTGQKSAFALAYRARAKGLEVDVHLPEARGQDFADKVAA